MDFSHRSRLLLLCLVSIGGVADGAPAFSQELKPAWRPKEVLAEYKAVPGTFIFLADVEVPEWKTTFKMLVDTGCNITLLDKSFDTKLQATADKLNFKIGEKRSLVPLYHPPPMTSQKLDLKPMRGVLLVDLTEIREELELPISGVLGMDCLSNLLIHIDFDHEELLLARPAEGDKPPGSVVPLKFKNGFLWLNFLTASSRPLELCVDTGMFGTMEIKRPEFESLMRARDIAKNKTSQHLAMNFSEKYYCDQGTCLQLKLGEAAHRNLHVQSGSADLIGAYFLARYRVTFDVKNRKAYFDPGRNHLMRDASELDGATFDGGRGKEKIAISLDSTCLAYQCGLRENDVVVTIGGKSAQELNYEQFKCLWMTPDADLLKLQIRRGEDLLNVKIEAAREK